MPALMDRTKHRPVRTKPVKTDPQFSETELVASICRESFFEFVQHFWSCVVPEKFVPNWHVKYLCDEVQKMAEKVFRGEAKDYDLVVNISPGTTKSLIFSVFLPAWVWTRMPSFKFIGASYSYPLAMELSNKCRDVVQSDKYQKCFAVGLRSDQNTKGYFKNTAGGWRYAVGVNGSVTGYHAHLIVIDDPLNPEEAASELDLHAANRWIQGTLSSRKIDKLVTPTVLVMQRLHQDDPTAQFLRKKNVQWICLPAEATPHVHPPELRRYYTKGLMDPVRLSRRVLEEQKENGEYFYAAQFLQTPVPPGGGMFKTKRVKRSSDVPQKWRRMVRYWDKAGTAGGGAYTVGTLMGLDWDGHFWVLDVVRGQWDSYERERIIATTAAKDGQTVVIGVEQEPGSGGKESAESTVRRLAGYKVRVVKVDSTTGGKVTRADPWSVQVNAGNVYVPKGEEYDAWFEPWLEEHKFFPFSRYKDQVDATAGAFSLCHRKRIRVGGLRGPLDN